MKDLRLENVCDIHTGNAFLPGFLKRFNERFALPATKPENLHRPLNQKTGRLNDILCHREQRYVSEQLTMSYDRKQIILERNDRSESLGCKYVDLKRARGERSCFGLAPLRGRSPRAGALSPRDRAGWDEASSRKSCLRHSAGDTRHPQCDEVRSVALVCSRRHVRSPPQVSPIEQHLFSSDPVRQPRSNAVSACPYHSESRYEHS